MADKNIAIKAMGRPKTGKKVKGNTGRILSGQAQKKYWGEMMIFQFFSLIPFIIVIRDDQRVAAARVPSQGNALHPEHKREDKTQGYASS